MSRKFKANIRLLNQTRYEYKKKDDTIVGYALEWRKPNFRKRNELLKEFRAELMELKNSVAFVFGRVPCFNPINKTYCLNYKICCEELNKDLSQCDYKGRIPTCSIYGEERDEKLIWIYPELLKLKEKYCVCKYCEYSNGRGVEPAQLLVEKKTIKLNKNKKIMRSRHYYLCFCAFTGKNAERVYKTKSHLECGCCLSRFKENYDTER